MLFTISLCNTNLNFFCLSFLFYIQLNVPADFISIEEALRHAKRSNGTINTIHIQDGNHEVLQNILKIDIPIRIVGESETGTVVQGGVQIQSNDIGCTVALQNLSIIGSSVSGVWNQGQGRLVMVSCTVKDCNGHGIEVWRRAKGILTNVIVRGCKGSGIVAKSGATIEISGDRSRSVIGNCTKNRCDDFGLNVKGSASKIFVVGSLLTKEKIAEENGGGGNFGGSGKIASISVSRCGSTDGK